MYTLVAWIASGESLLVCFWSCAQTSVRIVERHSELNLMLSFFLPFLYVSWNSWVALGPLLPVPLANSELADDPKRERSETSVKVYFSSSRNVLVKMIRRKWLISWLILPGAFRGCALTMSDSFHELVASIVLGFNVEMNSLLKERTRRYFPEIWNGQIISIVMYISS